MDNKTFISHLSKQMNCETKVTQDLVAAFADVLRSKAADLDTIAIPGFGNFVAMKKQEKITIDPETGKRILIPPCVSLQFVAGSMLKKNLKNE